MNIFTAKDLKNKLWNILLDVETKKVDIRTANTMISAAREILNTVHAEIEITKLIDLEAQARLLG